MDGWTLFRFCFFLFFFIHTTLPLIKLVQRSKLFILFVSYVEPLFFPSLLVCVCVLWLIEVEGAHGMLGIYRICPRECCWWRRLCVWERGAARKCGSPLCILFLPPLLFLFGIIFVFPFFCFSPSCALTCFMWIVAVGRNGILRDNYFWLGSFLPCCRLLLSAGLEVRDLACLSAWVISIGHFLFDSWTRQMFFRFSSVAERVLPSTKKKKLSEYSRWSWLIRVMNRIRRTPHSVEMNFVK